MIEFLRVDPASAEALSLQASLSAALSAITGDSGQSSFEPDGDGIVFFVARQHGRAVACGCIRRLDDEVAEIKRMYAEPGTVGVGFQLLRHLEAIARAGGYRQLCLSTRRVNARAVAFYERNGYAEIAAYGRYAGREQSICLGKILR